jgi:GNAT superfamily N-acetyltransferase
MNPIIRVATDADIEPLSFLLRDYTREAFSVDWPCESDRLRDALTGIVTILLAVTPQGIVGFVAAVDDYDLHHCLRGLRVIDLYVARKHRGQGVGLRLLAHMAARALTHKFEYLRGEVIENQRTRRFLGRIAIVSGESINVGGKALRLLAEQRDQPLRQMVRGLPSPHMNYGS